VLEIHKKTFFDEDGNPREFLIPWEEYRAIEEALGLDLSPEEADGLRQARQDRESGDSDAYVDLEDL
jgi:PHD/YefM family antitoxin component YafN of YafNO toxin-antitoxin module